MEQNGIKEIFLSPLLVGLGVYIRTLIVAVFLCGGAQLFDFTKPSSILSSPFTIRRIIGLFFLISGMRMLIGLITFITPFD